MRKFLIAAALACLATPALADHPYESIILEYLGHEGFDNRGQCESAIVHERNERRQHYDMPFDVTDPEYNHAVKDRIWCEKVDDRWYLVGE